MPLVLANNVSSKMTYTFAYNSFNPTYSNTYNTLLEVNALGAKSIKGVLSITRGTSSTFVPKKEYENALESDSPAYHTLDLFYKHFGSGEGIKAEAKLLGEDIFTKSNNFYEITRWFDTLSSYRQEIIKYGVLVSHWSNWYVKENN